MTPLMALAYVTISMWMILIEAHMLALDYLFDRK